jgi:uncharacterized membrane protein
MIPLKRIHFYFGLAVIAHFVVTGILMRLNYFSIQPEDTLVRMMFRANHIYILFSGLVHLLIHYALKPERPASGFHFIASGILILATLGISAGFYLDPIKHLDQTPSFFDRKLTGYSVQACLLGTGLHLLLLQFRTKKNSA